MTFYLNLSKHQVLKPNLSHKGSKPPPTEDFCWEYFSRFYPQFGCLQFHPHTRISLSHNITNAGRVKATTCFLWSQAAKILADAKTKPLIQHNAVKES